jgi:hypothetical protein
MVGSQGETIANDDVASATERKAPSWGDPDVESRGAKAATGASLKQRIKTAQKAID